MSILEKKKILAEIYNRVRNSNSITKFELSKIKFQVVKDLGIHVVPKDHEIIAFLHNKGIFVDIASKPVRSISGIVVVSVFTKPSPCPGSCIYCPGGIDKITPSPKSYSGHEPAARRGAEFNFDPFIQIKNRLAQLRRLGHPTDKISVIIMGGTFLYLPREYRDYFMRGVYEGILERRYPTATLNKLQDLLEVSKNRLVELTFETRPDYSFEYHVDEMLRYGATRVEIGIQSLSDEKLEYIKRGHDVDDVRRAFRVARDAGLKIVAHMMPNLPPNPDPEFDYHDFKTLFEDPDFRPDMLKIYPTAVVKGTVLYELFVHDKYVPYSEDKLISVLARIKKMIPPWVRIQRLQRDIPTYLVEAGYSLGNLRQIVLEYMHNQGWVCRCIRCREVGHKILKEGYAIDQKSIKLVKRKYVASDGIEIFLSFEDVKNDVIFGLLRLRKPSDLASRPEVTPSTAIIRELHVYGFQVPLGKQRRDSAQHRGLGKHLVEEAEHLAVEEFDANKMIIISGIGVREYYRRLGYKKEGPYMAKKLI